jgi:nucleoside-specific outer membrane channel protein Tsx
MRNKLLVILLGLLGTLQAQAVSVSLLHGSTFRDDMGYKKDKTTMTIENFSLWEYGTVYFFYDITEPFSNNAARGSQQFYGSIAPTFSLSKITGHSFSGGFIRDVSIRVEMENGSVNFRNYFYGLQYDLAVPGFDFFSLNTVARDNPIVPGVGFQLGMFWQATWEYGPWSRFKFTGFLATSPWDGNQKAQAVNPFLGKYANKGRFLTSQPQFLYDLGLGLTGKPNRLEVGIELAYFINRYQIQGKYETAIQPMVKFTY